MNEALVKSAPPNQSVKCSPASKTETESDIFEGPHACLFGDFSAASGFVKGNVIFHSHIWGWLRRVE